ncbi:metallophosphoesterase family protein [uncultured Corynebacterium sp.]|uniref:metallophosphoesterase family protein n=1 Tax=uncultured Corynebacterium sp. TaxID=159447 RepID=UPI0025923AD9|nr:metallophosphoesterase family protein [uncultured Corynebacterium sp.]
MNPEQPRTNDHRRLSRRAILRGGGAAAAAAAVAGLAGPARAQSSSSSLRGMSSIVESSSTAPGTAPTPAGMPLSFNAEGRFTIVQFNDTQDDHLTDRRTIEFMGKVLDQEKPDFALINGDVITNGPTTTEEVFQALNNVVRPMEDRQVPWAITFGNHDEDSVEAAGTGVYERHMAEFVRQYKHNLNPPAGEGPFGHSDAQLLISGSRERDVAKFAIWLLDSGNYLPGADPVQNNDDVPHYDYIRPAQIDWYLAASREAEQRFGRTVPGLMYFHIPTYEHRDMWYGGPANHDEINHLKAKTTFGIDGVKNEDVYYGSFNSGIYAAVRDRGDVLGIYCGHDHINSYKGDYFGVELGYCPGTGFAPYGLNDGTWTQNTLRGARVFELNENSPRVYESTRLIFAKDLGVDMNPAKQPIDAPLPLPDYVTLPRV